MKAAAKPLEIPLATGCAQAADEYASPAGVRTATNLRCLKRGSLSKRPGARGLAGTTSNAIHPIKGNGTSSYVAAPAFVSQVGKSQLLGLDDGQVLTVDDVQGSLFEFCGAQSTASPVRIRSGHVFRATSGAGGYGASPPAIAVNSSGYTLHAAISGGTGAGGVETFVESPEGVRVYFQYKNVSAVQVRAHAVGTALWLVWQESTTIWAQSFVPTSTSTTVGTATSIATLGGGATYGWDTSAYDTSNWFLVHGDSANTLTITKFASTTSIATVTFGTWLGATPCSIWGDTGNAHVWVGYYDDPTVTGNVNYRVYAAAALASVKGETTIAASPNVYGPPLFGPLRDRTSKTAETTSAFYCFRYVLTTGNTTRAIYTGRARSNGSSPSTPIATWHCVPISKPDSRHRVWVMTDNGTANSATSRIALLRFHDESRGNPVVELALPAMLAPGATHGPVNRSSYFHAVAVGSNTTIAAVPRVLTFFLSVPLIQVSAIEYATAEQAPWRATSRGAPSTVVAGSPVEFFASGYGQGTAIITSDLPRMGGASEVGFLHPPVITQADTASGSTIAAGSYVYRAVFEWSDIYGRRHRSAPSVPFDVDLAAARDVLLSITTIDATQRASENTGEDPLIVLYRTMNGGTSYFRCNETGASDFTDGIRQVNDALTDAQIADEEPIYTDGGVLENDLGPSCRYVARAEDRAWFGGLFTGNLIQCSKVIVPEEPVQCTDHPSHQVVLPGECTGLAYMDGQVAAFTRDTILLINSGSGPNDQGQGEFAPPRLHTTGLGCVDGRSVLETPEGIFFLSQRGIELLPRGFGNVTFIGEAIKDLVQTSLLDQCGFAAYQSDKNGSYARFGLMAGSSEFSVPSVRYVATYDLSTAQWFVDDYGSETMGALGAWPNGFAIVRTDLDSDTSPTPIWYEDGSLVSQPETAGAAYIDSSIVLQRLFPFGHGGHGQVRRVVLTFVSHVANWQLTISAQTDDNAAQSPTWTITTTGLQRREVVLAHPHCSTLALSVSDTDMGANGAKQAATYLSLAIEADPLEGARGLSTAEKQ